MQEHTWRAFSVLRSILLASTYQGVNVNAPEQIAEGQVYSTTGAGPNYHWMVKRVEGETAYCIRVRKADGKHWDGKWDEEPRGFDFEIVREHWAYLGEVA